VVQLSYELKTKLEVAPESPKSVPCPKRTLAYKQSRLFAVLVYICKSCVVDNVDNLSFFSASVQFGAIDD